MTTATGAIVGQRCEVTQQVWIASTGTRTTYLPTRWVDQITYGTVVSYLFAVCEVAGNVEERAKVVVQTDDGKLIFASPQNVRVLEAVTP